jgi:hypothetical protein
VASAKSQVARAKWREGSDKEEKAKGNLFFFFNPAEAPGKNKNKNKV